MYMNRGRRKGENVRQDTRTMMKDCIQIKGARVNNLKNISLEIPRRKLVVVTLSLIHISEPTRPY